jgi:hypothetical protein
MKRHRCYLCGEIGKIQLWKKYICQKCYQLQRNLDWLPYTPITNLKNNSAMLSWSEYLYNGKLED